MTSIELQLCDIQGRLFKLSAQRGINSADYLLWNGNRVQIKRAKFEKYVDSLEAI